jgi:hypothetical protein
VRALESKRRSAALTAIAALLLLGACASKPAIPPSIVNISGLIPLSGTELPTVRAYQTPTYDHTRYRGLLIEPVTVYEGSEADFGHVSEADRQRVAAMLTAEFKRVVGADFRVVDAAGPGIVRLHMSLIGIDESHPVLSTALRLTPVGIALSGARGIEGKGAPFTGDINIAGVAYDSENGQVLVAAQALIGPSAVNVTSGITPLRAAELSTTRAAERFRDYLIRVKAKS